MNQFTATRLLMMDQDFDRNFLDRYPEFLELYEQAKLNPDFNKHGFAFTALWEIFKSEEADLLNPTRVQKILEKKLLVSEDEPYYYTKLGLAEIIKRNLMSLYTKNE